MERSRPAETSSPPPDTRPLDWTGFLLLVRFSIWSLLAILPLQLFSPVWAHQLVVTLANNAPLLLIGVALLRLAIAWGAGAPAVRAWRLRVCRLRQVQGPQLTSTDLAQPRPDLKLQLRASLASNFAALRN